MVANKPDWVWSRQRAWGVPLSIFVRKNGHEILFDDEVNARIADAYEREGADAWFAAGAKERFLGRKNNAEGPDRPRGWFQSPLLESCGTRGRAPFDIVLTHGFTLDESGRKMSKSLGNQTFPEDVIRADREST